LKAPEFWQPVELSATYDEFIAALAALISLPKIEIAGIFCNPSNYR
jgi:hypothetical protein